LSTKKLILLELAKKDADKIVEDTVRDFGLDFSLKVINELEKAFIRIKKYPQLGSFRIGHEIGLEGLRSWALKKAPFIIFYLDNDEYIIVIRILHQKQHIPFWLNDFG
jgi:toxin ParE1/3/4